VSVTPSPPFHLEILEAELWPRVGCFCVCAGSRNSLILKSIDRFVQSRKSKPKVFTFFDERAASFFALGYAKSQRRSLGHKGNAESLKMAVVVTTSGTAVAEILPAIIEAHYSELPLIALTADRPRRYRNSGAPQSIEQVNIFKNYITREFDVSASDGQTQIKKIIQEIHALDFQKSRIHLNLCFEDSELALSNEEISQVLRISESAHIKKPHVGNFCYSLDLEEGFLKNLQKLNRPLVIFGPQAIPDEALARKNFFKFIENLQAPIWMETQSNPRLPKSLEQLVLVSGERILNRLGYGSVLRIGGVPTSRVWRDLEASSISVLSVDEKKFSGLSQGRSMHFDVGSKEEFWKQMRVDDLGIRLNEEFLWPELEIKEFLNLDKRLDQRVKDLLNQYPLSEPAWIHRISEGLSSYRKLFLGNSMVIREWDLFSSRRLAHNHRVESNRGANGIDGELSSFLGWVESNKKSENSFAVLGDLTTLYDLSAPWVLDQMTLPADLKIIVINNGGGKIFSRLPSLKNVSPRTRQRLWELNHEIRFENWAKLWSMNYVELKTVNKFKSQLKSKTHKKLKKSAVEVWEILPDFQQTEDFWKHYGELFL
jgi:2-succinyl-5-enolpyruvyl-6-hydroxy-3-cyclohexene-1-carboxylate synthase